MRLTKRLRRQTLRDRGCPLAALWLDPPGADGYEKALKLITPNRANVVELLWRFDSFCDDIELEIVCQYDDGINDCARTRI